MNDIDLEAAVNRFLEGRDRGEFFPEDWLGKMTVEDGYRIQLALLDRNLEVGKKQLGWKIGLTAPAIQRQFNVHEPAFGFLMAEGHWHSGDLIDLTGMPGPGFENELCMVMGKPLWGSTVTVDEAYRAVEMVLPALEIIETRGDSRGNLVLGLPDNIQQRGIVTGQGVSRDDNLDLSSVQLTLEIDGSVVDQETGTAVMGNPINSVVWLASMLHQFGLGIEAGQYIMTGSFTRQYRALPGINVRSIFDQIGAVEAQFV